MSMETSVFELFDKGDFPEVSSHKYHQILQIHKTMVKVDVFFLYHLHPAVGN